MFELRSEVQTPPCSSFVSRNVDATPIVMSNAYFLRQNSEPYRQHYTFNEPVFLCVCSKANICRYGMTHITVRKHFSVYCCCEQPRRLDVTCSTQVEDTVPIFPSRNSELFFSKVGNYELRPLVDLFLNDAHLVTSLSDG